MKQQPRVYDIQIRYINIVDIIEEIFADEYQEKCKLLAIESTSRQVTLLVEQDENYCMPYRRTFKYTTNNVYCNINLKSIPYSYLQV